jgi:serine-type D-Ala-D-Ala carboxypeptidase (penicillin-binding protein 5/6)
LSVGVAEDVYVTAARKHYNELKAETQLDKAIIAPIAKGDTVGSLSVSLADEIVLTKPLVAMNDVAEGGIFRRLYDAVLVFLEK